MSEQDDPRSVVDALVRLLTVERSGAGHFIGTPMKGGIGRVFGGQVIAQALQAAQASAPAGMVAHSLHAYFLRGGTEGPEITYRIDSDFDGRSFANRRVMASQHIGGETSSPILNLTASFQVPEDGMEHDACTMPDVPPPERLSSDADHRRRFVAEMPDLSDIQRTLMLRPRPIELRPVDRLHWMDANPKPPRANSWFRTVAPLPDDPALHRAAIAYASDYTLLGTSALPHGLSWARGELKGASLDHAIWFHRPARADEWLLYATESPWSGSGRGMNHGRIFNLTGDLVASVAQEGMMRRARS